MLAPRTMPAEFHQWNRRVGAPHGFERARWPFLHRARYRVPRVAGPFGLQPNNTTRAFEYPWAWSVVPVVAGSEVVDLGGSLAGFQFVLSRSGLRVWNIDPGESATSHSWPVSQRSIGRLNRAFHTDVKLVMATLGDAALREGSIDTLYSISTIEHIPSPELPGLMREIERVLTPGGSCVLTIDLFLNLEPFSRRESNEFGTNVPVKSLVEASGLDLVVGDRNELYGYPEFDPQRVMANLERYLIGDYPALAQCLVLRKAS